MTSKNTFRGMDTKTKALPEPRLGETMNEAEHLKLITELKASCVVAHLAFLNADLDTRHAADDDYLKAKSAYEKALAVKKK